MPTGCFQPYYHMWRSYESKWGRLPGSCCQGSTDYKSTSLWWAETACREWSRLRMDDRGPSVESLRSCTATTTHSLCDTSEKLRGKFVSVTIPGRYRSPLQRDYSMDGGSERTLVDVSRQFWKNLRSMTYMARWMRLDTGAWVTGTCPGGTENPTY